MKILKPNVGPIIGETTPTSVRVWIRGKSSIVKKKPRRGFGIVSYRKKGNKQWIYSRSFKLNPNFDLTGICVIEELSADTIYEYRAGYFYSDAELEESVVISNQSDWGKSIRSEFRTASSDNQEERVFAIGSCRYLLKTFLGNLWDDRGDKTFRTILNHISEGSTYHQFIMMGDQIYADDLSIVGPDRSLKQFYKRYRTAFKQPYLRELMSRVPTYMTLDDHEIEDNWPSKAKSKDWKTLYPVAMHAYQTYQLSHSPNLRAKKGRLLGTPKELWYSHTDGCCDIFVTDTRTERFLSSVSPSRIMSKQQMRALKNWLSKDTGRVKIIVSSVPFFPDVKTTEPNKSDKWNGFATQRVELLEYIERKQIKKVIFLSGDVHASMSVQLESPTGLKILSVVSSAFFWPYPGLRTNSFQLKGAIDGGRAGDFILVNPTKVFKDDNFTKLSVSPESVSVEVYERKKANSSISAKFYF